MNWRRIYGIAAIPILIGASLWLLRPGDIEPIDRAASPTPGSPPQTSAGESTTANDRPRADYSATRGEMTGAAQTSASSTSDENRTPTFDSRLNALGVFAALVIPSAEIDEAPRWSPDGQHIAVNMPSGWMFTDINKLSFALGDWQGVPVAVNETLSLENISEEKLATWKGQEGDLWTPVVTSSGTKFEIEPTLFGAIISITTPSRPKETLWQTELEQCFGASLSPDESKVLFKCVSNGVFVMDLEKYSEL